MKKDTIPFQDFIKTDVRVGKVINATLVEGSSKLIELIVDLGEDYGTKTIFTGMQKWYAPENFQGKNFLFVANLEPKQMMGKESQGMIMAADKDGKPQLIEISDDFDPGLQVI
jgi:methionyl-tRNA synthetase